MNTTKDIDNKLMKRREISFKIESEKNPNFEDMKKLIVDEFKAEENLIDVYNILGNFGSNSFTISADIYKSKEDLINTINLRKSKKQKEADVKASEGESESGGESKVEADSVDEVKEEAKEVVKEEPKEEKNDGPKEDKSDTVTDEVIEEKSE